MLDKINRFFDTIQQTPIELYSEFGLQHELAIFLRSNFPDLIVRLEYPTPRIFNPLPDLIKKEIDIYITTQEILKLGVDNLAGFLTEEGRKKTKLKVNGTFDVKTPLFTLRKLPFYFEDTIQNIMNY